MKAEKLLSYGLPLFEGLTPDDLAGITLGASEQSLDAWQTIFDQEDNSNDLYFLLSGSLLAVFWTTEGREIVFSRFPVGAYFGELAAFDGTSRSLAVVAKTNSKVLSVKRESFLQLFNEVPVLRDRITRELVARIRTFTDRNIEMTTLSVEQRVGTYLLRLAAEHGKLCIGAVIENAPTHAEIAGSIGANREMVSRSVSKLAKRGIIKSARQRIEILDPEALSNELA
jgi:CRP-like cAMP-binding protein